jgi:hypothetical protein
VGQSNYTDGEGVNIGSDCSQGKGSSACWTDYFLVGYMMSYGNVTQPGGPTICGNQTGDQCTQQLANMKMSCTTFTVGATETLGLKFGEAADAIGLDLQLQESASFQSCSANTTTSGCTWAASSGCHAAGVAPLINTVYGYKRRSCHSPTSDPSANMPNSTQRPDGNYTRGMQDFAVPVVRTNAVNCNASCNDFSPWASPNGGAFVPWPTS